MIAEPDDHVWDRMIVGWHLAFWVALLIAGSYVVTAPDMHGPRAAALALLAVLAVTYAATVMRRGPLREGPDALAYLVVAVAVTGLACALDPFLAMLLFLVYPQIWLLTHSLRRGTALTVLLTAATIAGFGAYYGFTGATMRSVVPQMLVSLAFSTSLGVWISRVVSQSRERGALLAQLTSTRTELAAAHHAQGVVAERERVAREIHDTLAQGFTSVVMLAQAGTGRITRDGGSVDATAVLSGLRAIEDVARDNLAEARALVAAFSPPGLTDSTLTGAVHRLAERFGTETGVRVEVAVQGDLDSLGRDREVVLLRAAQEALTNVRRHARAQRVVVRLVADPAGARVEVGDDGIGLAPSASEGFGLRAMRGRVSEAGGELDVASSPGAGTTVTVRLPALAPG